MKEQKQEFYNISKLLKTKARYFMVFGERSNGKTFQILLHGLKKYLKGGGQIAVIRRWKEDFKIKRAQAYFNNLAISTLYLDTSLTLLLNTFLSKFLKYALF